MEYLRRLMLLMVIGSLLSSMGGCVAFYSYHPVRVAVYDAETNAPIAGAVASVSYRYVLMANAPVLALARTDQSGKAVVRAATFAPQVWSVSAAGYAIDDMPEGKWVDGKPSEPVTFFLYREPLPQITIMVPNGYRGPLKIDMRPVHERVQEQAGKRKFTFKASPTGAVRIDATPLLLREHNGADGPSVIYDNGQAIPAADYRVGPSDTALRWITSNTDAKGDRRELYVVGTAQDEAALLPIIYDAKNGNPHDTSLNQRRFDALFDQAQ